MSLRDAKPPGRGSPSRSRRGETMPDVDWNESNGILTAETDCGLFVIKPRPDGYCVIQMTGPGPTPHEHGVYSNIEEAKVLAESHYRRLSTN